MARETDEDEVAEPSKGTVTVDGSIDIRDFFAAIQTLNPGGVGAMATPAKPTKGRKRSVDGTSPEDAKANVALATFVETPGAEGGDGADCGGAGAGAGVPKNRKTKAGGTGEGDQPKKKKKKKCELVGDAPRRAAHARNGRWHERPASTYSRLAPAQPSLLPHVPA